MGRRKDPSKYIERAEKPCPDCTGTTYYKLKKMSTVCVACHQAYQLTYKRKTGRVLNAY